MKLKDLVGVMNYSESNCAEYSHALRLIPGDDPDIVIIGTVCGAVLFILLFILAFVLCLKRMKVNLSRKAVSHFVVPKSSLREDKIEGRGVIRNLTMKCILPGMISDFEEAVNLGKLPFPGSICRKTRELISLLVSVLT